MRVSKTIVRDYPGLGAAIKAAREQDGRSMEELAQAAGFGREYWWKIEAERVKELPLETLRKIEEVLGADFKVFLDL